MKTRKQFGLTTLGLVACLVSPLLQADVIGLTLKAEHWLPKTGLYAGDHLSSQNLAIDKSGDLMVRLAFEHPLPLLPNIALQRQQVHSNGEGQIAGNFGLDNQFYPAQTLMRQQLSMTSSDVLFYYELLDTPLISFDVGFSLRQLDASVRVDSPKVAQQKLTTLVPMAYFSGQVWMWGTDTATFWQAHYTDVKDQRWFEGRLGLRYELLDLTVMTTSIELGWQMQDIDIINKDQIDFISTLRGPFVAVEVDF